MHIREHRGLSTFVPPRRRSRVATWTTAAATTYLYFADLAGGSDGGALRLSMGRESASSADGSLISRIGGDAGPGVESVYLTATLTTADAGTAIERGIGAMLTSDSGSAVETNLSAVTDTVAYTADMGVALDSAWLAATFGGDAGLETSQWYATAALIVADMGATASSGITAVLGVDAGRDWSAAFASIVVIVSPFGATDPDAATLVLILTGNPTLAIGDPDSARLIVIAAGSPVLAVSDPDSARIVSP
jgi:hypothetical protein